MIINNPHEHGNKPYRKYLPLLAALLSTDAQLPLINSRHIKEKGAGSISVVLDLLATAGYSAADECYIQRYPSYEIGHINRFSARHSRANHDDPSAPGCTTLQIERVLRWLIRTRLRVSSVLSERQTILRSKVTPQKST